jgi:hypothetical protein
MKKKILLLSIIIFPSLLYFFFELTQANFKKMPYFGPKTVDEKGDTVYWSVKDVEFKRRVWARTTDTSDQVITMIVSGEPVYLDTVTFPVYVIVFLNEDLKKEGYKLNGLYDYIKFKSKDLKNIPIVICSKEPTVVSDTINATLILDSMKLAGSNFHPLFHFFFPDRTTFLKETYFKQKPIHVFDYFMVLVDKKRHIRGYYDPSYNAEVKRMIDEYKHLKIRDEYAETLKQNDIKQKDNN